MRSAVVVAVVSIVLATTAAAQERRSTNQPPIFRTGTNLVALNVTVTDTDSQFVRGLSAEDFVVFEDGMRQELQFFEALDVPKDLIILIDTSSSMRHQMDIVHEAAIGFLQTLRDGDRGAIVTFDDTVEFVQGLTEDRDALEQAVRRTSAKGATALYNALYISLREYGQGVEVTDDDTIRRQAIVVLTDGEDTSSLIGFDDVLSVARKSGVSVYAIAIQGSSVPELDAGPRRSYSGTDYSLRQIARETGAQAFFAEEASELRGIYDLIAQELSSQYSLGYAPADTTLDGRFRQIVVGVAERPELRLRTRTGYTADRDRTATASLYREFVQER